MYELFIWHINAISANEWFHELIIVTHEPNSLINRRKDTNEILAGRFFRFPSRSSWSTSKVYSPSVKFRNIIYQKWMATILFVDMKLEFIGRSCSVINTVICNDYIPGWRYSLFKNECLSAVDWWSLGSVLFWIVPYFGALKLQQYDSRVAWLIQSSPLAYLRIKPLFSLKIHIWMKDLRNKLFPDRRVIFLCRSNIDQTVIFKVNIGNHVAGQFIKGGESGRFVWLVPKESWFSWRHLFLPSGDVYHQSSSLILMENQFAVWLFHRIHRDHLLKTIVSHPELCSCLGILRRYKSFGIWSPVTILVISR